MGWYAPSFFGLTGKGGERNINPSRMDNHCYDAVGNVISTTDFKGDTISFDYDVRDRLRRRWRPWLDLLCQLLAVSIPGDVLKSRTSLRDVRSISGKTTFCS
jgi:YD repeat-containing protein